MTSRPKSLCLTVFAVGVVCVLAGCGSSTGGTAEPSSSTKTPSSTGPATDVPTGFDGCNLPQSFLDSEKLENRGPDESDLGGGLKLRGCRYLRTDDGYGGYIRTTNLTVDMVRAKQFPETKELTVDGRRAISSRQFLGPNIKDSCTVDVEMKGGSLDINVNNPPSRKDTGKLDSCDIAKSLADKIAPMIPAGA
ncbi:MULTISPECIES: DUF3558 domain-containing protein [unclassified Nocardia]|uniref:DUF3558 domain-containing protein n=1 Tax=unclassified Nocardia TaxID=2637762 RepID=UPI001CE4AE96|nr:MULTISPECIES: DUF3558 domain-containing protein [unclassified Nocardia]